MPELDQSLLVGGDRADIGPGHVERVRRDIGRDDAVEPPLARQRERYGARSGANVSRGPTALCGKSQDQLDEHFGLRARDQHALVDVQLEDRDGEGRAGLPRTASAFRERVRSGASDRRNRAAFSSSA